MASAVSVPAKGNAVVSAGRYRYDDDHPEIAIKDLFEGDGSQGYEHPALYRLAERVMHCSKCGATQGRPCLPASGGNREARARQNHATHKVRRVAAAERMSRLLADCILSHDAIAPFHVTDQEAAGSASRGAR